MNNTKKYGMLLLKVLLAFSLVFPYCCHTEKSEHTSHQQEVSVAASHSQQHNASECSCGHQLAEDYQKSKKTLSTPTLNQVYIGTYINSIALPDHFSPSSVLNMSRFVELQKPPLHLLNSVFLN